MSRLWRLLSLSVVIALLLSVSVARAQTDPDPVPVPAAPFQLAGPMQLPSEAQSTSGPTPPPDLTTSFLYTPTSAAVQLSVPAYLWRHGCGPTAAGMVLAYWDSHGFGELFPGDASSQANADEGMASTLGESNHYVDYAEPVEGAGTGLMADCSEKPGCQPHPDDSIADFMLTSRSARGNQYGWSWYSDMIPAFQNYVKYINATRGENYAAYPENIDWQFTLAGNFDLFWNKYVEEIQAGRPVVLLVDTDGDGVTDHFVTGLGYDVTATGQRMYAANNTWSGTPMWYPFKPIGTGTTWGIYGMTTLKMLDLPKLPHVVHLPIIPTPPPDLRLGTVTFYDYPQGVYYGFNSGNGDLQPNAGEFIVMRPELYNASTYNLTGVEASLIIDDPYVNAIPAYTKYYRTNGYAGQISAGKTGSPYFYIGLAANTPNGRVIPYTIEVDATNGYHWSFKGSFTVTGSDKTPPMVYYSEPVGQVAPVNSTMTLYAFLLEAGNVKELKAFIQAPDNQNVATINLYDDGKHYDGAANDRLFAGQWKPTKQADFLVDFKAVDSLGNTSGVFNNRASFSSKVFQATKSILLVRDAGYQGSEIDYYTSALNANGRQFDYWDSFYRGPLDTSILSSYLSGVVIYAVPEYGHLYHLNQPTLISGLKSYLNSGGQLFISGQDIGYYLNSSDSKFLSDYLHAKYVQDDTNLYWLNGKAGDPISSGLSVYISGPGGANNQMWPDEIDPLLPAEAIFTYQAGAGSETINPPAGDVAYAGLLPVKPVEEDPAGALGVNSTGTGGVRVSFNGAKVVYLSFGFEAINDSQARNTLMQRILQWLQAP